MATRTMLSSLLSPSTVRASSCHSRAMTTLPRTTTRRSIITSTTAYKNSFGINLGRKTISTGKDVHPLAEDVRSEKDDDVIPSNTRQQSQSRKTMIPRVSSPLELLRLDSKLLEQAWRHDKVLMSRIADARSGEFHQAVTKLQKALSFALGSRGSNGLFQESQIDVYGSCSTDLYCEKNCDVDVSYYLPRLQALKDRMEQGEANLEKYKADIKRHIFVVKGRLTRLKGSRFRDIKAINRAGTRVPLIKACYRNAENPNSEDGSIWFDMTFNNHLAVRNSALLSEYTKVDPVSKNLMLAVKKWAKDNQVCTASNGYLSSYAWVVLVIFYLQQIGMLPNLQSEAMMKAVGFRPNWREYPKNSIDGFNTAFVQWRRIQKKNLWQQPNDLQELPISLLMHGFFHFLLTYGPKSNLIASIRTSTFQCDNLPPFSKRNSSFFCIEDPFETFDSHSPRDLSRTLHARGESQTMHLVEASERYLKAALMNDDDKNDKNMKMTIGEWWKHPEFSAVVDPSPK